MKSDMTELEHACINASIRLLQGLKGTLSADALRYRMIEVGEELIAAGEVVV